MSTRFKSIGSKTITLGQGIPQEFPIQLDPAPFEGAIVYAENGTIKLSDGTQWVDVGAGPQGTTGFQGSQGVQGLQGDYGPGFTIIGSVPDVDAGGDPQATLTAAFPTPNIGDGVIDEADDELWIWDGTNWINIGSFRGVQGFQGNQGIQGLQGTLGQEGIQGSRGYRGFQGHQGPQGIQGIQGDLGFQGMQGTQGPQAAQGIQGIQGVQGVQGVQGPQAAQGVQGIQGYDGIQGFAGSYGGVTFEYAFVNNSTASDPGAQNFKYNNGDAALSTQLYIDDVAGPSGTDISAFFNSLDNVIGGSKAYMRITIIGDPTKFLLYDVTEITDNTGWFTFNVTYVAGSAVSADLIADPNCIITFSQGGAQGIQGPQAAQGIQGDQGVQGIQGVQGVQGPQGTQGVQGFTGIQGQTGSYGGVTFEYDYTTSTAQADPGAGTLAFNDNTTIANTTELYIDALEAGASTDISDYIASFASVSGASKGYIRITQLSNINRYELFQISDVTDNGGWLQIDVTHITGTGTPLIYSGSPRVIVTFSRTGDQGIQGPQGAQGFQGSQGAQGTQGTQGFQGSQGAQGFQGTQGLQGRQGIQGVQGVQGSQGLQGLQGAVGDFGGLTFDYTFDTSTSAADPGQGILRFDNAAFGSATKMYIDDLDDAGNDLSPLFTELDINASGVKGLLRIIDAADVTKFATFNYTEIVDSTGYHTFDVTHIAGETSFANNLDIRITFVRTGDPGVQGTSGAQGVQGNQGVQGLQGSQGFQGLQGHQGLQGVQGPQGLLGFSGGLTFRWEFNNSTSAGFPGLNSWLINNSDVTQATQLYIDDLTETGRRVDGLFDYLDTVGEGQIFIRTPKDPSDDSYEFVIYQFSNWTWSTTGTGRDWGHFDISWVASSLLGGSDASPGTSWQTGAAATFGDSTIINFIPKGDQGVQGVQGLQGYDGAQGFAGVAGGVTFSYDFNADTGTGIVPSGELKFNNGTLSSATEMRISDTTQNGVNLDTFFQNYIVNASGAIKAFYKVISVDDPSLYVLYAVTGTSSSLTQYVLTSSFIAASSGATAAYFTANPNVFITFSRNGDDGPQGIQGLQGVQGTQGLQGLQGNDGAGAQGIQGLQGGPGFQGAAGGFGGVTFDYTFKTDTDMATNPNAGNLKLNNAVASSADELAIHDRDDNFIDISQFLQTIDDSTSPIKGHYRISRKNAPEDFVLYAIDGSNVDSGSYTRVQSSYVDGSLGSGTFTQDDDVIITFARTGDIGADGPQGIQGIQGVQGVQGIQGQDGGAAAAGPQGTQGLQGLQGDEGGTGGAGPQGPQGVQGYQGTTGSTGLQGPSGAGSQGLQGIQGPQGPQGFVGSGGAGNQGAQGLQGDAGPQGVQGVQGNDGSTGQGSVGSQGIQGYQGTQGLQGNAGSGGNGGQGVQGLQGIQGLQGPQGTTASGGVGVQGVQGIQGPQGLQGSGALGGQGTQGIQGFQGFQGTEGGGGVGTQGVQGIQGYDGPQGTTGTGGNGTQGPQGPQGFQGMQGPAEAALDGSQGVQGFDGIQGPQGVQGFQGADGNASEGTQGPQGPQGFTGADGLQGVQGYDGSTASGAQGIQGPQGTQGFLGPQGTTGAGVPGSQGAIGFQGVQGNQGTGGSGTTSAVDVGDIYATGLQTTQLFVTFVQGGSGNRPLYATLAPNPSSDSNFYYQASTSKLTVENIDVAGNLDIEGNLTGGGDATVNVSGSLTATNDITTNSDVRLKENVIDIENALAKVLAMRGVEYNLIGESDKKIGLIAQEVEKIIPQVVNTDEATTLKSVAYGNVVSVLIEAIKEQQAQIDELKNNTQ